MNRKLKPLLPSLREKKRYLAFRIISKGKISQFLPVLKAINSSIFSFLGELGAAKAGTIVLEDTYNPERQSGIIRVSHRHVDELRSALMTINKIEGKDSIVITAGVSGMLKKAGKYTGG